MPAKWTREASLRRLAEIAPDQIPRSNATGKHVQTLYHLTDDELKLLEALLEAFEGVRLAKARRDEVLLDLKASAVTSAIVAGVAGGVSTQAVFKWYARAEASTRKV